MTWAPLRVSNLLRSSIVALSLANLCLLEVWRQLFSKPEDRYYFARSFAAIDYAGALIALGVLGVFFLGLLLAGQKLRPRPLWQILFAVFTLVPLNILRLNSPFSFRAVKGAFTPTVLVLGLVGASLVVLLLWRRRSSLFAYLTKLLLALSPFVLFSVGFPLAGIRVSGMAMTADASPFSERAPTSNFRQGTPPVVVLLFDELDNRFIDPSTRPPDLELPELDRLRGESIVFENAVRAGAETLDAVPSLTIGEVVDKAEPRGPANLQLVQLGQTSRWGDQPNVFDLATKDGFEVHLVGWYHPYCRIFPTVASCSSQPYFEAFVGQSNDVAGAVGGDIYSLSPFHRRTLHVQAYERILLEAKRQTASAGGLIWVHFPIPHIPVIYDRKARIITSRSANAVSGYLDNVALVDQTIGQIREQMSEAWDRSVVVLVSDHNWRQSRAFDGKSNDRVPFYIKLPGPSPHQVVTSEISARVLPYVLLALLRGEIKDSEQLLALVGTGVGEPLR